MTNNAVLLFTFSPIQPFISEARRTADLHTASQILVHLARAAGQAIVNHGGDLVYPADLTGDTPNKIAALVEWDKLDAILQDIETRMMSTWQGFTDQAQLYLQSTTPTPNWQIIWDRQINHYWQHFWAAARMGGEGADAYRDAYRKAQGALDARKRTRDFAQTPEPGEKDTLSGQRQALTNHNMRARDYWASLRLSGGGRVTEVRPGGRERLDALGATKRFCQLARTARFPSTSALAARPFAARLSEKPVEVQGYVDALNDLLGGLPRVGDDANWPYDGDLLYAESLTRQALEEDHVFTFTDAEFKRRQKVASDKLSALYTAVGARPSTYYAILALDGDNMGRHVDNLLADPNDPLAAHTAFSRRLDVFGRQARAVIEAAMGSAVYSGGDDVLALIPLENAIPKALELLDLFHATTVDARASAGIAVVHHTYPLDAALRAARAAEQAAKHTPTKDSLCVRVLKRSGEIVQVITRRAAARACPVSFASLTADFQGRPSPLSGRLPYAVQRMAYALPKVDGAFISELSRLISRHSEDGYPSKALAGDLSTWARTFQPPDQQGEGLAHWLGLARFIAKGGQE